MRSTYDNKMEDLKRMQDQINLKTQNGNAYDQQVPATRFNRLGTVGSLPDRARAMNDKNRQLGPNFDTDVESMERSRSKKRAIAEAANTMAE